MGHSQEDKARSHERIVERAAARFRECGIDGIGLADLMKEAGLSHGGFYRHFSSRDELVAEAVEHALADGGQRVADIGRPDRPLTLGMLIDAYLSPAHRDHLAASCAVATMAADVARGEDRARAAYSKQVEVYLRLLTDLVSGPNKKIKRARAITALAALVGSVSMARAVKEEKLSREILASAAQELVAMLRA
jgi:TetR/AcrR family transcriptional regulator, transcriptional repressor for nem operon